DNLNNQRDNRYRIFEKLCRENIHIRIFLSMMKGRNEIYLSHVSGEASNITLRGKNIFGDKRLASGERGKNPPA
ncbi:hypothetical protein ABEO27_28550, partial [Klebsiella pneumoniae]